MKKILLLAAILQGIITVFPVSSQTTNKGFSIQDVRKIKLRSSLNTATAGLLERFDKYRTTGLSAQNTFNYTLDSIGETSPLFPYKTLIDSMYSKSKGKTLVESSTAYPTVMPYKANKLLIFHTLYHYSTYNEARLSQQEMIARVISDALLPVAYQIGENENINVQYIGLDICYSHKDFTKEYASEDWDYILLVIPTEVLKDYANTYISDQDLIAKSDVYCGDDVARLRRMSIMLK